MRYITILILFIFTVNSILAQENSFKEQAIEQFENENYTSAIELMEKALDKNPNDADVYYYLGFFNHFNAYDSRPLKGYNSDYSDKILNYLDKSLELNPNHGNAKYFYFIECLAVAFKEYQQNNLDKVKEQIEKAYQKGVIPEWAIELGKTILNSCEKDAILFTHGDYPLNICLFVQLHNNFRKDISLIPLALLDRPSFDLAINENKDSEILRGVDLGLTKEQILDIHPYKWDTTTVNLSVPSALINQYSIPKDYTMDWVIEPDLYSERTVARIKGAENKKQAYLSPTRAMLLNIMETNKWIRPIYFTNTFETYYLAGLDKYFQNCGMVSKLTPIKTKDTPFNTNVLALETLVFNTELPKLKTIINNDQPRASGIIGLYQSAYYILASYYKEQNEPEKIDKVIDKYKQNLMIGFKPENEKGLLDYLKKMIK
jgi:tetratricopeptide (TPR) repeat protein